MSDIILVSTTDSNLAPLALALTLVISAGWLLQKSIANVLFVVKDEIIVNAAMNMADVFGIYSQNLYLAMNNWCLVLKKGALAFQQISQNLSNILPNDASMILTIYNNIFRTSHIVIGQTLRLYEVFGHIQTSSQMRNYPAYVDTLRLFHDNKQALVDSTTESIANIINVMPILLGN